ncbi:MULTISPECIES: TetR/AcrR family transcriptional regulator [Priestia]|uniref:TetR/AcrR family transcriptional regulator n=1 Tax=Priestia TaxID=2800373 RepID=UPI0020412837|nr:MULTISPECIES: TetR/AcrR family transcriptional regulator [Priestia]MCM3773594.1 TetR/AcrR family transcriptional regulator [Priestia aryabhattai]MDY0942965.1 TetR/AcrR family transcriptional regulator [Priestia megaterium]
MAIDRKQSVVDAASKSFALFGYKATTMEQVAKLANVGKGTIYTFFKNKEELFDEIVTRMIREMTDAAETVIDSNRPFFENAQAAIFRILEFRTEHQLMLKLVQEQQLGTTAVQEVLVRVEEEILTYIKNKIEIAISKKEIKPCDPELTAFLLFKMYIALVYDWEKRHEPLSEEKIAELIELYFLRGLSQ